MSKEVHCKNCKWDRDFSSYTKFQKKFCKYISGRIRSYFGEQLQRSTVDYLNKNNDCPYYKRKWWKFWVKETE